ncbi:MAG: sigma-70 family RNA polymerase sigma factor [Bacteroidota bacterium]
MAISSTYELSTIKQLYIRHRVQLVQWLVKMYAFDPGEATELAQSAFAIFAERAAAGSLPSFERAGLEKTYLFAIAKNKAREQLRLRKRTTALSEQAVGIQDEEQEREAEAEKRSRIELASKAFAKLGEKCQQLLKLAIVFKTPMQDIAQQMDYENAQTVKTRKYKCLQRLRTLYTQSTN